MTLQFSEVMKPILRFLLWTLIVATPVFYIFCLNHVSINEVGIAYNSADGSLSRQGPGWHITSPMVRATTLSTLPFKVDLSAYSGDARVVNVKLVRFVPEHTKEFVETNGFMWMGPGGMQALFTGYAFSGKKYPFLEILQ